MTTHPLYLKKQKKSIFTEFPHYEYPDLPLVIGFIENKMGIKLRKHIAEYYPDEQTHYTAYLKNVVFDDDNNGSIPTSYYMSKSGWGRVNSTKSLSMNVMHRPTRHAFAKANYIDFDMVNCQVQVLFELAKIANLSTDGLKEYCYDSKDARTKIAEHYKLQDIHYEDGTILTAKEQAKKLALKTLNESLRFFLFMSFNY